MEVLGSSAGITYAIVQLAGGTNETAKQAREVRKSLHHGFVTIYQDREQLPTLVPVLRDALILGLADIIQLPRHLWRQLRRLTYPRPSSIGEFVARVTLYDLPVSRLRQSSLAPEITLQVVAPRDAQPDSVVRTTFGNFLLGVKNHDGRWGDGELKWIGHSDPEIQTENEGGASDVG